MSSSTISYFTVPVKKILRMALFPKMTCLHIKENKTDVRLLPGRKNVNDGILCLKKQSHVCLRIFKCI